MSSIARVIFFVAVTVRMRCRYSRICAPMGFRLSFVCWGCGRQPRCRRAGPAGQRFCLTICSCSDS